MGVDEQLAYAVLVDIARRDRLRERWDDVLETHPKETSFLRSKGLLDDYGKVMLSAQGRRASRTGKLFIYVTEGILRYDKVSIHAEPIAAAKPTGFHFRWHVILSEPRLDSPPKQDISMVPQPVRP